MEDKIKKDIKEIQDFKSDSIAEIEEFRIKFLGKKGLLNSYFVEFKSLDSTEKKNAGRLLNELKNSTKDIIIFTAATPDQGGTGHINCQERSFWIDLFEKNGCVYDIKETEKIKERCIPTKEVKVNNYPHMWAHVYRNLMVFRKNQS